MARTFSVPEAIVLEITRTILDNKSRSCGKNPFTQIPMLISKVDRTALVANLGSPAALILERACWDAGKQIIRRRK